MTAEDLYDRPVPVRIQALMSKLGISFEEYQETDLQPVVDLVNWALTTPPVPENTQQPDAQDDQQTALSVTEYMIREIAESITAALDLRKQQRMQRKKLTEKIWRDLS
ncbi:TPA: hypothetical protein I8P16_000893 [Salmonella enterica subsp. enterica serovar Napoli]|nr:hypothetical protein [Salmonella enterica subsp. enterica serovar Napoli]HBC0336864.1 hypothetical protein [Salmonella enterica subsp. enterica serovar Napoli]